MEVPRHLFQAERFVIVFFDIGQKLPDAAAARACIVSPMQRSASETNPNSRSASSCACLA